MMTKPKITFGIINCNRLFYLKSCLESLLITTCGKLELKKEIEVIVVDNASVEDGTLEYLSLIEKMGVHVIKMTERDYSNEFAKGLNTVVRLAKSDIIAPLQGDMQFIRKGWLDSYIELFERESKNVGCIMLDAQRSTTIKNAPLVKCHNHDDFFYDTSRSPIGGAGDVVYHREILNLIGPWSENNLSHEGGNDSETDFLIRVKKYLEENESSLKCIMPKIPPAAAIYTDSRGTNARVRGSKRYGNYWPAKGKNNSYYRIYDSYDGSSKNVPFSIEQMVYPIDFIAPIGPDGVWLKNPIKPETALPHEYIDLTPVVESSALTHESYVDEWLNS